MKKYLFLLLALSACGHYGYEPKLAKPPTDMVKYENDRKYCIDAAYDRVSKSQPSDYDVAKFGLLGYLSDSVVNDQNDDYHKTPMQMADECMVTKGYKVIVTK